MKVLYQWARRDPQPWQQVDSAAWASLPTRTEPNPGQLGGQNNVLGWVNDVCVQGLHFNGSDHVSVEDIVVGLEPGVRVTSWWDDPVDYPPGERRGRVWTILPLAPDPNLGGAINTRMSQVVYAEGQRFTDLSAAPPQNTLVLPWADFVPPSAAITRHQVWLTDIKYAEHLFATQSFRGDPMEWGWRDWVEHLPDSEVNILPGGRRQLRDQRPQGRYKPSEHTLTWYQRNTDLAASYIIGIHEDSLLGTAGGGETETATVNATEDDGNNTSWVFHTPSNEPNSGAWPNCTYRCQLDCTAASAGLTYGKSAGAQPHNFRVARSDLSAADNTVEFAEAGFTGTGLKLGTQTMNPTGEIASDRWGVTIHVIGDSHADAITIRFSADAWADGPWPSTAANDPPVTHEFAIGRQLLIGAY